MNRDVCGGCDAPAELCQCVGAAAGGSEATCRATMTLGSWSIEVKGTAKTVGEFLLALPAERRWSATWRQAMGDDPVES